ncbi:C-type mannose receptor 2-like isoform X1 [Cyprinus carpio]|uniref:C-type mannose receptor 2-like isoform X1 n=1 Tax=Cyprinus carpio TaxID=7962 RepID=A0A9R0AHB9_CYPCA|nr:C-type mannose receptor 2-like isoform X1 [Cyprinus carpio]XP_042596722.1 C-type mannose receptor 2-like isoform X1 [Cyprinus carpio]
MVYFLLVVFGLLSFTSSQISHQYHFINIRKTWTEAQRFCREMYTDLATVNNDDEMNSLFKTITDNSYDVYTGLYRGEVFRWHWTLPDSVYNENTFQDWEKNQPDNNNNKGCAAMDNNGKWFTDSCDAQRQFVCFNVTATKTYILIEQNKSWKEAQEFCRTFHTDLVNVRTSSENQEVKKTAKKDVWIGLFKDPWSWSDQSNSSFRFWNSSQLSNNRRDQDCVTVMVNQTGKWNDVQCNTTQPFICHGVLKSQPTTKPATTDTEGGNRSTQPTQTLTTGAEQDNMILVRENLTWTEAVTYCRKHHVDLVSIHSEELQNRTARKATQASTSHVWLGLRYTCSFNFWFWIKNREADCYQNWAPGHGPHGYEECGLSGAMESTGGHQWVGRPESERLNFICQICTNAF